MNLDLDIMGKLFPDPITMAVQLVATAVLFYGLKRLMWVPMQAYLAKRAEAADFALSSAYEANQSAKANQEASEEALSQAARDAQKIIESGKTEGQRLKDQILADARNEADNKLSGALREIARQRQLMQKELETEIVDVALLAASKLIEDKMDEASDRKQVQDFIKDYRN
jgi:F-type H+-transporting ATPase subunit b